MESTLQIMPVQRISRNFGEYAEEAVIIEEPIIKQKRPLFIEANTIEASLEHLRNDCIIPVFAKDNEATLSHVAFIEAVQDAAKYFLVLDGQHRTIAASLYNEWAAENGEEAINVPAIEVELQGNETIAEYINEINITKKEWTTPDYVRGAANINPDNEFLQRYNELIKSEKNPDGYPISTLNLIFCGNNNAISKSDFSLLCSGKDEKGKKVKKPIIPAYNMEIGNKFIQICKDKGFDDKDIAKRYLSNQFNNIKTITGDVKEAVKIFQSITQNDKAAMFNTHGNLDENLVMEQFEKIRERYNRPTTVISIKDSKEVTANDDTEDIPYLEAEEV